MRCNSPLCPALSCLLPSSLLPLAPMCALTLLSQLQHCNNASPAWRYEQGGGGGLGSGCYTASVGGGHLDISEGLEQALQSWKHTLGTRNSEACSGCLQSRCVEKRTASDQRAWWR